MINSTVVITFKHNCKLKFIAEHIKATLEDSRNYKVVKSTNNFLVAYSFYAKDT